MQAYKPEAGGERSKRCSMLKNNSLIWTLNHEMVRIEPWGRDSLRVRSTVTAGIRDDLVSILLPPADTDVEITIGEEGATLRNGAITARVSPEGLIRFLGPMNWAPTN